MKRYKKTSVKADAEFDAWQSGRVLKKKMYADMKTLLADIQEIPNDAYDQLNLSPLYAELLDSLQHCYRYCR